MNTKTGSHKGEYPLRKVLTGIRYGTFHLFSEDNYCSREEINFKNKRKRTIPYRAG